MQARIVGRVLSVFTLFVVITAISTPSHALPAFARQTGKACNTCHFQHYPSLNAYGREFKAGGYIDIGKEGQIKGRDLSLPETLNASIFFKARYQKSNGKDLTTGGSEDKTIASGELQFPDEFALLIGGRASENVGFLLEANLIATPTVAGFKVPFNFELGEMKVDVIPYTTDSLGASYGFELLNTGAVRNVRIMEHRSEISAQQYIGTDGAASGIAFVLWDPSFYINYSRWSPNHAATAQGNYGATPSSNYVRAVWTPSAWDWDFGIGAQYWSGSSQVGGAAVPNVTRYDTKASAFDVQAQGAVGGFPLGVYVTHAVAKASSAAQVNWFNTATTGNEKATAIAAELGVLPGKLMLMLAYRDATTAATTNNGDDATTFGAAYHVAQNLQLQLQYSKRGKAGNVGRYAGSKTPGDTQTTLMLSGAF